MTTKYLLIDNGRDGKAVEAVSKGSPDSNMIPLPALVIKTIDTISSSTFMVSSQKKEVFRIFDLLCKQETNGFQGLLPIIDVITQEEIVSFWWKSSIIKQPQQVVILAMDVTTNFDGCVQIKQNGLVQKYLARLKT